MLRARQLQSNEINYIMIARNSGGNESGKSIIYHRPFQVTRIEQTFHNNDTCIACKAFGKVERVFYGIKISRMFSALVAFSFYRPGESLNRVRLRRGRCSRNHFSKWHI